MSPPPARGPGVALINPVLLLGALALPLVPGILLGVCAAELLHRRHQRWTWHLAPTAIALAAAAAAAAPYARHVAHQISAGTEPLILAALLSPAWLLTAPPAALAWHLRRARLDRLHGGHRERRLALATGPAGLLRRRRATRARHATTLDAPPRNAAQPIRLGTDDRSDPLHIAPPRAHITIVGGSNSGKTNTAEVLLEARVAAGGGFIVLDGKGGRDLPHTARLLGARHDRPVALWSLRAYGDPDLDTLRRPWNAVGSGDPTEIKDRIASSEDQDEPYYKAVASHGLLAAANAQHARGRQLRLDDLARLLADPKGLSGALTEAGPRRFKADIEWIGGLTATETSGLRGMALRLQTMVASTGGDQLLPAKDGSDIRLHQAIRDNHLVVFSLPQGTYPELIPHVARYLLQALNAVATRLEQEGHQANCSVFVDELSAFDGDQLCAGYERGRSAGMRYIVATQSLSNFATTGGDKLLHAAIDNAEQIIVHRQAVPDAVELLAAAGGTEEAWEHTHKVQDGLGAFGLDEPGERARRLTDRFRAHPNTIKQLRQGEAILISTTPEHHVRRVRVRPGPRQTLRP